MIALLSLSAGIIFGFILGYWLALGEIQDLEIQNAEMEGRLLALDTDEWVASEQLNNKEWSWPGKGY